MQHVAAQGVEFVTQTRRCVEHVVRDYELFWLVERGNLVAGTLPWNLPTFTSTERSAVSQTGCFHASVQRTIADVAGDTLGLHRLGCYGRGRRCNLASGPKRILTSELLCHRHRWSRSACQLVCNTFKAPGGDFPAIRHTKAAGWCFHQTAHIHEVLPITRRTPQGCACDTLRRQQRRQIRRLRSCRTSLNRCFGPSNGSSPAHDRL